MARFKGRIWVAVVSSIAAVSLTLSSIQPASAQFTGTASIPVVPVKVTNTSLPVAAQQSGPWAVDVTTLPTLTLG